MQISFAKNPVSGESFKINLQRCDELGQQRRRSFVRMAMAMAGAAAVAPLDYLFLCKCIRVLLNRRPRYLLHRYRYLLCRYTANSGKPSKLMSSSPHHTTPPQQQHLVSSLHLHRNLGAIDEEMPWSRNT